MAKPIPERYHSVTPHLIVRDAAGAIAFYREALGAQELFRMPGPDGETVLHAELKIGDSIVLLGEESIEAGYLSPLSLGGAPMSLMIYCQDSDNAYFTAIGAGCLSVKEPVEMFWGDRFAQVKDPYGFLWTFATHVRDVSQAEMREVLAAMSAEGG